MSGPFDKLSGKLPTIINANSHHVPLPPITASSSYRPSPPPVMPKLESDLEKKKNEIVQEMLRRIRPFMGPHGQLRSDTDFTAFANLMAGESYYVQRTLLLAVLLSATSMPDASNIFQSMCSSTKLISVLTNWLGESIKQDSPLIGKLLEVYQKLPLTIDQLVEHRLGKLVKKLVTTETIKQEVRDKAAQLCDDWTKLARQEDAKRRSSADGIVSLAGKNGMDRRKSEGNIQTGAAVANMTLFNDTAPSASLPPPPPPLKTRAEQILERIARGETSKVTTRPLSADDIHKAKKRQQYLQEATNNSGPRDIVSVDPVNMTDIDENAKEPVVKKRKKKRVSFANENDLVTTHYFDPPEDDYYQVDGHHYSDVHEMEKNEASFAFKQMSLAMEAETDWTNPRKLEVSPSMITPGEKSVEKDIQEVREHKALSAVYFSLDDVPPSPAEYQDDNMSHEQSSPKIIPLKDAEGRVSTIVRFVDPLTTSCLSDKSKQKSPVAGAQSSSSQPTHVNIDLLSTLLKDPGALQDILKNVPPASAPALPPPIQPAVPRSIDGQNRSDQFHRRPPSSMMFGPPPSGSVSVLPPNLSFPLPPHPMTFHPMPIVGNPPMHHMSMPIPIPPTNIRQGKNLCKYYRKGRPGSCRYGTSCQFYHAEH